jgi:hypothetical protein
VVSTAFIRDFLIGEADIASFSCYSKPPASAGGAFTDLIEPLMVDMQLAFIVSIFAVSPYIFYQIWAFIALGLYESERKYVVPVAIYSELFLSRARILLCDRHPLYVSILHKLWQRIRETDDYPCQHVS